MKSENNSPLATATELFHNSGAQTLIVFLHGIQQHANNYTELFDDLRRDERFQSCNAIGFSFDASLFSNADPDKIAAEIAESLEELSQSHSTLILVGHSLGGLVARRTILVANETKLRWKDKVDRLVLLASTNRGYVPRTWLERRVATLQRTFPVFGRMIASGMRGSPWINRLRIDWAERFAGDAPEVIQILGSDDEVVESDDSADLMYYPNAHEVRIEGVHHTSFCQPDGLPEHALEEIKHCFFREFVNRPHNTDQTNLIVMLVHGIRDFAEWHESLSQAINKHEPNAIVVPVQYGYFNAFQFLQPLQRHRASRIFADKYIQTRLKYPSQPIAIAAHSNGTYAVAQAITDFDYIAVARLYLAGSVLPRSFPWSRYSRQVGCIRNDIANQDWPVGVLCRAVKLVDRRIGTAGFLGFEDPLVQNNQCLDGPHGAALEPPYRAEVAEFLCKGTPTTLSTLVAGRKPTWDLLSLCALPAFLAACGAIIAVFVILALTLPPMLAVFAGAMTSALLLIGLSSI